MSEASVSGLFRTVLILIGVFVLLRFIGQLLIAKNNIASQNEMKRSKAEEVTERERSTRNAGKTHVLREKNSRINDNKFVDVDFTEVKE